MITRLERIAVVISRRRLIFITKTNRATLRKRNALLCTWLFGGRHDRP